MCYSVESSIKTTVISFLAIVYLLSSGLPYFQWIGITLIGWCGMQFAELLLWLTNPRKECTEANKIITMSLIPLVLVSQPLGALFGSLFVIPWNKSSLARKQFFYIFTISIFMIVGYYHFYNPEKICTTVTPQGHLNWSTSTKNTIYDGVLYFMWACVIVLPLFLFWNWKLSVLLALIAIPALGFLYGPLTDSKASIWCFYTSYTSIIASALLFLKNGIWPNLF